MTTTLSALKYDEDRGRQPGARLLLDRSRQDGLRRSGATTLPADPKRPFSATPHTPETPIHITVSPAGGERFHARAQERHLCTSRTPFLSAARVLMKEGVDPDTPITLGHDGSATVSLRSTIGQAARLTVEESDRSGPRFVPYHPFQRAG
jgi:hypothetical protein